MPTKCSLYRFVSKGMPFKVIDGVIKINLLDYFEWMKNRQKNSNALPEKIVVDEIIYYKTDPAYKMLGFKSKSHFCSLSFPHVKYKRAFYFNVETLAGNIQKNDEVVMDDDKSGEQSLLKKGRLSSPDFIEKDGKRWYKTGIVAKRLRVKPDIILRSTRSSVMIGRTRYYDIS